MIFLIRHGETDLNKKHLIQGSRVDFPLNENGISQALERGKAFEGKTLDVVISSPLKRSVQTAQLITKDSKIKNFITDDRFIERDFGKLDGTVTKAKAFNYYFQEIEGAEDPEDLYNRIFSAIKDISKSYTGNILIVSHGGISGSYVSHQTQTDNFKLGNTCCILIDPEDCHLIDYNLSNEQIREYLD